MVKHFTSELSSCKADHDCHGNGRRCLQNRCEGFAGSTYVSHVCMLGDECSLNGIRGHFDSVGTYKLIIIDGPSTNCGAPNSYKLTQTDKSSNENEKYKRIDIFAFNRVYTCEKSDNIEVNCNVRLGEIAVGTLVGNFAVCGCSNVQTESDGVTCSSPEAFNVPLGYINIHGFGKPHINFLSSSSSISSSSEYCRTPQSTSIPSSSSFSSALYSASSSEISTTNIDIIYPLNYNKTSLPSQLPSSSFFKSSLLEENILLHQTICRNNSICLIPDFGGYEINSDFHYIKAVRLNNNNNNNVLNNSICNSLKASVFVDDLFDEKYRIQNKDNNLTELDEKNKEIKNKTKDKFLKWECKTDATHRRCIISLNNDEVSGIAKNMGSSIGLCGCSRFSSFTKKAKEKENKEETWKPSSDEKLYSRKKYDEKYYDKEDDDSYESECAGGNLLGILNVISQDMNIQTDINLYENNKAKEEYSRRLLPSDSNINNEYITDEAANILTHNSTGKIIRTIKQPKECDKNSDCLNGMGQCVDGVCTGFFPDLNDERLFRCVEAYNCNLKKGDVPGKGITEKYMVIAISPAEACGTAPNLQKFESLFQNSNKWACDKDSPDSCMFRAGVGFRRNKTHTVEGVRLCGCPDGDMNGDNIPCNHVRDFYVPIGRLGVQECLTNAHCIDKRFAYCIFDHCGGFLVSAASAGLKIFQCMKNQDCTLEKIAAKSVNEALKVLPVAANFTCGAEAALDPDSVSAESLPCLIDMNNDGNCDINLGVTKALGTSRLCGCSGQDLGGSGKACDQLEDFDTDLGMLSVGECIINSDCPSGRICAKGECLLDTLPPYVVNVRPANDSVIVPPVKTIDLIWNENIEWGAVGKRIVLQSMSDPSLSWEVKLPENATGKKKLFSPKNVIPQYELTLGGQTLKITPDTSLYTFPEGVYRLGYEYGFVNDLQKNPNDGSTNIQFAISKDAGCPYLYLTGFSTENGNPNWLYEPIDPISGKAAWKGGERKNLFIYWKKAVNDQPGNWILDTNLDPSNFLAFPELDLMDKLPEKEKARPPSGTWMKWSGTGRIPQEDVIVHCSTTPDKTFPTLLAIEPKIGEVGWPIDGVIKMTFSKQMNYGHWASINIVGRDTGHTITLVPDWEAHMRGEKKPIRIKPGKQGSIVELHLPENLKQGETYDLIVEMGALTDLAYNPWGPVEAGTLVFTTFGSACPELSNLGIAYVLNSTDHFHDSVVTVGCANGYTSKVGEGGAISLRCTDGSWSAFQIDCKADCGKHPLMGSAQYTIEGDIRNTQHGAKLRISCAADAMQIGGNLKIETIVCREGKWDNSVIICGGTCGSFPSLGPNYFISENGGGDVLVGTKRKVKCAGFARSVNTGITIQEIACQDGGWQQVTIQCHVDCLADFPGLGPAYKVEGEGKIHGSSRSLSCAKGYISTTENNNGVAFCDEGKWVNDGKLDCRVRCPDLNLGDGYEIKALPPRRKNSHMSQVELSCTQQSLRESGPASETLTCTNGAWSLFTISCRASCGFPLDQFGDRYEISNIPTSSPQLYMHGSSLKVMCATGANPIHGSMPQTIVCDDGRWRSENKIRSKKNDINSDQKDDGSIDIDLICKSSCSFPKIEIIHKINPSMKGRRRASYKDGTFLHLTCSNGYSASDLSQSSATMTCNDGNWDPKPTFMCYKDCEAEELLMYGQKMDYYVAPLGGLYTHGITRQVTCQSGSERITGPKEDKIVCKNGHFSLPRLICGSPTCDDNLKNGDEVGIDCGGSCPEACRDTCTDGIKNGDEEDIDCGGSICPSCMPCSFPPDISHVYALSDNESKGNVYVDVKDITGKKKLSSGTAIYVQCAENYWPAKIDRNSRVTVLYCRGGAWNTDTLHMECLEPSCDDGIQNGDEYGVDCGGSCQNSCPTCYDGIRNGDEEYVDCGGSCDACTSCSLAAIKPFVLSPDLYSILKQKSNVENVSKANLQQSNTAHGVLARVACARDASVFSDVVCLNGAWAAHNTQDESDNEVAKHSSEELEQLNDLVKTLSSLMQKCQGSINSGQKWDQQEFLQFRVPRFLESDSGKQPHTERTEEEQCMYIMLKEFMNELEGECGALVYGGSLSKVAGFCEGSCLDKLRSKLKSDTKKCNEIKNKKNQDNENDEIISQENSLAGVPQLYEELLKVFCEQRQNPQTKKKEYCFASASDTLNVVSNLNTLAEGRVNLQAICPAKSCFRSNLQYLLIFSALSKRLADLEPEGFYENEKPANSSNTGVSHESIDELDPSISNGPHSNSSPWNRRLYAASELTASFETFAASLISNLLPNLSLSQSGISRVLQETKPSTSKTAFSAGTAQYIKTISNINTILDLICLEVEGSPCAPFVLAIAQHNPVVGIKKHFSLSSGVTDTHPCKSKCYLEVTRRMGQALRNSNRKKNPPHPYDTALSTLMISYGRLYCQQSYAETYCGELIFPDVSSPFSPDASPADASSNSFIAATAAAYEKLWYFEYTSAKAKDFPSCSCPIEFIGDGDCDLSCFVPECGWDYADCLVSTMFPELYLKATQDFPLYSNCNPYRDDFSCSDNSQDSSCTTLIQESIEKNGCCTAALFEVLRDLLEIDSEHPLIQSGQMSLFDVPLFDSLLTAKSSKNSLLPAIEIDRSVAWIEQTCQVSLDRTCSRGLQRAAISVDLKVDNLMYSKLFGDADMDSGSDGKKLLQIVRRTVADLLAVPVADITQMITWPGSVDIKMIIDAGWLTNLKSFNQDIQNLIDSGLLAKALTMKFGKGDELLSTNSTNAIQINQPISDLKFIELDDVEMIPQLIFEPFKESASSKIEVPKESVKSETLEVKVPPVSSDEAPSLPLYGTFGMGRMAATLPRAGCVEDLQLDLPKTSRLHDVYEMRLSGTAHAARREVACVTGYDATKGTSPQELICDQGRWVAAGGGSKLVCRLPCEPYEKKDEIPLGPEYVMSGVGEKSGDTRTIYCARGFTPSTGPASGTETLTCDNGQWTSRNVTCVTDPSRSSVGSGSTHKAIGGKCLEQIQPLGEPYSVIEIGYTSSDVPKNLASEMQTRFPPSTKSLQLLAVNCARGFTSNPSSADGKQNNSEIDNSSSMSDGNEEGNNGVGAYYLACLDGILYGIGTENPFGADWVSKKNSNMEEETAIQNAEELDDRIRNSAVMDLTKNDNEIIRLMGCTVDIRSAPVPPPKPLNDTLMITLILMGILLLFIILVIIIYLFKRKKQKEAAATKQKEQQAAAEAAFKEKRSDATEAGTSVISDSDIVDVRGERMHRNDPRNVAAATENSYGLPHDGIYRENKTKSANYMLQHHPDGDSRDSHKHYANGTLALAKSQSLSHVRGTGRVRYLHGHPRKARFDSSVASESCVSDTNDEMYSGIVTGSDDRSEYSSSLNSVLYSDMLVAKRRHNNPRSMGAGALGPESFVNWKVEEDAGELEDAEGTSLVTQHLYQSGRYRDNNGNAIEGRNPEEEIDIRMTKDASSQQHSIHKLHGVSHSGNYHIDLRNGDTIGNIGNHETNQSGSYNKEGSVSQTISQQHRNMIHVSNNAMEIAHIPTKRLDSAKSRSFKTNSVKSESDLKSGIATPHIMSKRAQDGPSENHRQVISVLPGEVSSSFSKYTKSQSENRGRTARVTQKRGRSSSRPVPVLDETSVYYEEQHRTVEDSGNSNYLMAYGDDSRFMNDDDELYPEDSASCVAATIHARSLAQQQLNMMQQMNSRNLAPPQQMRKFTQQQLNSRGCAQQQPIPGKRSLSQKQYLQPPNQPRNIGQSSPNVVGGSGKFHKNGKLGERHDR